MYGMPTPDITSLKDQIRKIAAIALNVQEDSVQTEFIDASVPGREHFFTCDITVQGQKISDDQELIVMKAIKQTVIHGYAITSLTVTAKA